MTTAGPTRRRFLAISAAACATAGAGEVGDIPETRWQGMALGADASIRIAGLAPAQATPVLTAVAAELRRLEAIFSLHHKDSDLVRLNAHGRLSAPPRELLDVLGLSDTLVRATNGAFDPTVQPLFSVYARAAVLGQKPNADDLRAARAAVGWDGVRFDDNEVRLLRPGTSLTLNGVAQGYITDRIADLLRARGLADVLVDAGEIAAFGARPDGAPWTAGVAAPDGALVHRLTLSDRALATSAPKGTVLDPSGRVGHIFDPALGTEARAASLVAVSAPGAAVADGLSTALCVVPPDRRAMALATFPGATIELAI